jgi:hypothetical protein
MISKRNWGNNKPTLILNQEIEIKMKKILVILIFCCIYLGANAQDFAKNMTEARTSYSSGSLTDARFAMEQMLHDLDMTIGKEILKLLPESMNDLSANIDQDNVNGVGAGFGMGLYVQRTFGNDNKTGAIYIINNSPLINSISAFLSMPFVGRSSDGNQKMVKVQGYKGMLTKTASETGEVHYELQVPLSNTLFTIKLDDTNEDEFLKITDSIPLAKIAQMAQ